MKENKLKTTVREVIVKDQNWRPIGTNYIVEVTNDKGQIYKKETYRNANDAQVAARYHEMNKHKLIRDRW
jgi:hypothetical protein